MFKTLSVNLFKSTFQTNCNAINICKCHSSSESAALSGVRILDLTRIVAGPYCTMILGDLGADVIKIEHPKGGDEARKWGPPFVGTTNESCYFLCLNRNKRSMCVDLKSERGREIIYNLAEKSDVLVENYVPGKLDSMKLGYDDLKVINPKLIYCSITGYGSMGPYKDKPGYDVIAASIGGLLHITGPKDGEPVKVGVAMTDMATGLYAHGAILAALIKRSKTNIGQKIDCNLLSTQVASLINIGSNYLIAGKEASRWGTAHESIVPYESFPTKDGYYTVGAGSNKQFVHLCQLLGILPVATDQKFSTNKDRVKNRKQLINILRSEFSGRSNKELSVLFADGSFPNGPVNNLQSTFEDAHVKAVNLVQMVQHPTAGSIRIVGPAVNYSSGGCHIRIPPPTLGQHTDEVLTQVLGYHQNEINALKKETIIR